MIIHADCKDAIKELIEKGIQVDSIVTDPPYELGFMGKSWDKTGIANDVEMWNLCYRVLKPGGHLLSFGGSRTYHRMASAIEDAGFEIRDQIMWVYGSGFPKSLDISKAIDKAAGAEREHGKLKFKGGTQLGVINDDGWEPKDVYESTPATDEAKQWNGWGTALKPAHEPIVLARKPLSEKTVAANVLKHGTGGLNIDGCRVGVGSGETKTVNYPNIKGNNYHQGYKDYSETGTVEYLVIDKGRFPANLIHDGSEEVINSFPETHSHGGGKASYGGSFGSGNDVTDKTSMQRFKNDKGSASRFFYSAKASKKERNGSKHPTVKPLALMRYLVRLVTPPNGTVLDPFAGTGTTGQAAKEEGFDFILIEKDENYIEDIENRLKEES